ncbi:MAG: 50S ribosomal protein L9 [Lentisphaerae bacterium]|nr:50S ribosomal protein L9 [Lentisphaerota bacterium]
MADVPGLGLEGQTVKVAEGYARNYLLPRKLAAPVSATALKHLEKTRLAREQRQQEERAAAQDLAQAIEQVSCTIPVKVGENDKLFGSVHTGDIAAALQAQKIEIDRRKIQLAEPLRELGVYTVKIKLHPEVEAALKVWIVGE